MEGERRRSETWVLNDDYDRTAGRQMRPVSHNQWPGGEGTAHSRRSAMTPGARDGLVALVIGSLLVFGVGQCGDGYGSDGEPARDLPVMHPHQ